MMMEEKNSYTIHDANNYAKNCANKDIDKG